MPWQYIATVGRLSLISITPGLDLEHWSQDICDIFLPNDEFPVHFELDEFIKIILQRLLFTSVRIFSQSTDPISIAQIRTIQSKLPNDFLLFQLSDSFLFTALCLDTPKSPTPRYAKVLVTLEFFLLFSDR